MMKSIKIYCAYLILCLVLGICFIMPKETKAQQIFFMKSPAKVRLKSYKGKKLRLSWKRVEGANGYFIYQYKKVKKQYKKVADVKGSLVSWISPKTKTKQTYKICAYTVVNGRKEKGNLSYEVSAIPYTKKSKTVNAGEIVAKSYQINLGLRETKQMEVTVKKSRFAKNKKAEVMDTALRWYTTDATVATVDRTGNVTACAKEGECQIYARAHNGNYTGMIRVKVTNYARPAGFDTSQAQPDIQKLLTDYSEDLCTIAEYFEQCCRQGNPQYGTVSLDSSRSALEVSSSNMAFDPIRKNIFRILDDYPGIMEIDSHSKSVTFDLIDGVYLLQLVYIYQDVPTEFEETQYKFFVAPRWIQRFYRYAG